MNAVITIKKSLDGNGSLLLTGAVLGIYVNILHAVPFMWTSEFFAVFALIALSAITIPVTVAAWSQKKSQTHKKARLILKGMTLSSVASAIVYLAETLVGNYALIIFANPMRFPISRTPHISLLISLALIGLFIIASSLLRQQDIT